MSSRLWEVALAHDRLTEMSAAERRLELRALAIEAGCEDVGSAVREVSDAIDGTGCLTGLLADPKVTDVFVNGPEEVWVERAGRLELADVAFESREALDLLIERTLGRAGSRADASSPIADARLPDGSRIHVVMPEVAPEGPLVSIRKHRRATFGFDELQRSGTVDEHQRRLLTEIVRDGLSIVISGATGVGKTTLLGASLAEVPSDERIVTIEETRELRPAHPHAVSLVARPSNVEGVGEIDLGDLIRAALRMRPDRIVIGEVRGAEARLALEAMQTGHRGSMLTVHAGSARGAVERLVRLGIDGTRSERAVRHDLARSLGAVVQMSKVGDRRVITEIITR